MPDGSDYQWLAELVAHPERWTDADLSSVRLMIATQRRAIEGLHPKDGAGRRSAQTLVEALERALQTSLARRGG